MDDKNSCFYLKIILKKNMFIQTAKFPTLSFHKKRAKRLRIP